MKASRFAFFAGVVIIGAMLGLPQPAAANHFDNSAVKIYSKEYTHIDLGYYFDKAKDIFFSDDFMRKHPNAGMVKEIIDAAGYFAISEYVMESRMAEGRIWVKETMILSDDYPDSFVYKIGQLPDRPFKIGSLLNDDDYVVLFAINNFKQKAQFMAEYMLEVTSALPEGDGDIKQMRQAMEMLKMFQLRPEVLAALGDEIDFVLFEVPDITKPINGPQDVNAAALVPVANYEQAKKLIGMLGGFAGFNLNKPVFQTTEWKFWDVAGSGVGLGLSHDWLVIATNYKEFAHFARMSRTEMHEDLPWGNGYMRINVQKLYDQLGRPALTMMRKQYPALADDAMAYFFDITPETDFGEIKWMLQQCDNRMVSTFEMDDEVINGVLFFLCAGLETATGQQIEQQRKWKEEWDRRKKQKKDFKLPPGKKFEPHVGF